MVRPRPGARQDVAALAAFLASFGGGAGLNRRERCGCVMVCLKRMGLPKSDKIDGFCWLPNQMKRIDSTWAYSRDTPMYSMNIASIKTTLELSFQISTQALSYYSMEKYTSNNM